MTIPQPDNISPVPELDINRELAAGMKVVTGIARSTDKAERLQLFVQLLSVYYAGGNATGIIRTKRRLFRRIVAKRPDLTPSEIKALRKAKHGDMLAIEGGKVVSVISVSSNAEAVLMADSVLDEASVEQATKLAEQFNLKTVSYRWLLWLLPVIAIVVLALPMHDRVSGKATVIGERSYAVTASSDGVIERIQLDSGRVTANDTILAIENLLDADIKAAQIELDTITSKIREQGAYATENYHLLYGQREAALQKLDLLERENKANVVTARVDGIVQLKPDLLGTLVRKGDPLGVIERPTQNTITAEIPVTDMIDLKVGGRATFVVANSSKLIDGAITVIPLNTTEGKTGQQVYSIKAELAEPLRTGTTGTIVLHEQKTWVGWWLFRNQIAWVIAMFGVEPELLKLEN